MAPTTTVAWSSAPAASSSSRATRSTRSVRSSRAARITKITGLTALGVASSIGGFNFVPAGFPGAGQFKVVSYNTGKWFSLPLTPDGAGTYDIGTAVAGPTISGGPEGFIYVSAGVAALHRLQEHPGLRVRGGYRDDVRDRFQRRSRAQHAEALRDRPERCGGRRHRSGDGRLPLLDLRRRQPRHPGAGLRPAADHHDHEHGATTSTSTSTTADASSSTTSTTRTKQLPPRPRPRCRGPAC